MARLNSACTSLLCEHSTFISSRCLSNSSLQLIDQTIKEDRPEMTTTTMNAEGVANAYGRLAPVYDLLFGPVFRKGRSQAIKVAERIGGRILEVGVGTGLSLPQYAANNRIVGVDISEPMLEVARKRVKKRGLDNVGCIEVGDAEALRYPDESFDVVVAQYVVTACPNPEKAMD